MAEIISQTELYTDGFNVCETPDNNHLKVIETHTSETVNGKEMFMISWRTDHGSAELYLNENKKPVGLYFFDNVGRLHHTEEPAAYVIDPETNHVKMQDFFYHGSLTSAAGHFFDIMRSTIIADFLDHIIPETIRIGRATLSINTRVNLEGEDQRPALVSFVRVRANDLTHGLLITAMSNPPAPKGVEKLLAGIIPDSDPVIY